MNSIALIIAFLLEIIAFVFFVGVVFTFGWPPLLVGACCVGLLMVLVVFWERFMAPRAQKKLPLAGYYAFKAVIYAVAAYSIFRLLNVTAFWWFIALVLTNEAMLFKHNLKNH